MKTFMLMTSIAVALSGAACSKTDHDTTQTTGAPVQKPANDTALDIRDQHGAMPTPPDQANDKDDIETAAAIRRAVVADSSLSMDAKNVKIVVKDGLVTLRGPVKTEAERDQIEKKAMTIAGVTNVENHLDIEKAP